MSNTSTSSSNNANNINSLPKKSRKGIERSITIGPDTYMIDKEIGKGSFATVHRAHLLRKQIKDDLTSPPLNFAIKIVSRSKLKNKKLLENLEIEIAILKKINHPHIVKLIDCERTTTDFYLIMEYCALGDLTFLIKKRHELIKNHPLLEKIFEKYPSPNENYNGLHRAFILNYLQQLASALKFLRSKNLVHRDIKPQNLLLLTPLINYNDSKAFKKLGFIGIYELPILKIADFGFARFLPNTSMAETLCGSPLYMAPEILNYQKYNAKADLWSVGTVLYEMCYGTPPFKASNHLELYKKIKRSNNKINFPNYIQIQNDMKILISKLLTFDPQRRIEFDEFFNNNLVNEDLSHYESSLNDDDIQELESKSKNILENNMFISEYLSNDTSQNRNNKYEYNNIQDEQNSTLTPKVTSNNKEAYSTSTPTNVVTENENENKNETVKTIRKDQNNHNNTFPSYLNERTNSDIILEKDYVVIEKKSVEINALADELAKVGPIPTNNLKKTVNPDTKPIQSRDQQLSSIPQKKWSTATNSTSSNNDMPINRSSTTSISNSSSPGNVITTVRRPSLVDRRLSMSSLNPSNALSRAIGVASTKLFGTTTNFNTTKNQTQQQQEQQQLQATPYLSNSFALSPRIFQDLTENIILRVNNIENENERIAKVENENSSSNLDTNKITHILESLSARAFVVYSFAEVKFLQVIPMKKSQQRSSNGSSAIQEEEEGEEADLRDANGNNNNDTDNKFSIKELKHLCTEAIVLYMKTLEILAKSMKITSKWWYESNEKICSLRLNLLVQWIRERFNECLEKADYLRLKLDDVTTNKQDQEKGNDDSEDEDENDNDNVSEKETTDTDEDVVLEKLLYDRALEISKDAATMELNGENLYNCELSYATALWMLETTLEPNNAVIENARDHADDQTYEVLDEQDRIIIKKYMDSIATRLKALRSRLNQF
ncbi:serine/threonine protein kinase ATG1 NDAI_0G03450 [Naumovozyma dairenensis CBS 421]|uniref:Serine/threonine-protein kinase ATG1 n=1 Tax=Naumovozyma dairenensis (strain ATCC 10597 / BCRC 20456 / CBS 421 / NBRC 0211 / NRRL Y-12639) TaxID=1071378 RepID=G0WEB1_NAUDC|nr:hypothetical protein NDAI_0G03450 [Naumovozyma dairenensis CBS 421]CCD26122.2 hypothetical protein NDAI_0G03450 [Naumovozyma dairenensis CBS 421]